MDRLQIVQGDITKMRVDAIVNAANRALSNGAGVAGAIHTAAGPELERESLKLGGCPTGQARITLGYNLPARWVIHTVGPDCGEHSGTESQDLASCYRNCLCFVGPYGLRSIAFPPISTGIYQFPLEDACKTAIREAQAFLKNDRQLERLLFVARSDKTIEAYRKAARMILG